LVGRGDDVAARGMQSDGDPGQGQTETVVQVPAQPPPLFLPCADERGSRALQGKGGPDRLRGDADLRRQVDQESPIRPAQRLAERAW
jgi:hypothetical protein